eukprot:CAMPEP_0115045410 /NCGR_PEP_ID=MMETSP0216-20121206/48135_1 /TAXON_ID=223996 /ORGANISM="Protocruzia adherens, Strain Boccale" /LENGTH=409 /DNA_ID=CAMNT_0002428291 /DNA_START=123 /DNA_END=1349 /DNA_ORIENTATION=-
MNENTEDNSAGTFGRHGRNQGGFGGNSYGQSNTMGGAAPATGGMGRGNKPSQAEIRNEMLRKRKEQMEKARQDALNHQGVVQSNVTKKQNSMTNDAWGFGNNTGNARNTNSNSNMYNNDIEEVDLDGLGLETQHGGYDPTEKKKSSTDLPNKLASEQKTLSIAGASDKDPNMTANKKAQLSQQEVTSISREKPQKEDQDEGEEEEEETQVDSKKDVDSEEEEKRGGELNNELEDRGVMPVYDPNPIVNSGGVASAVKLDMSDMKSFLMRPCPKGVVLQCSIKRDRKGFNRFYPKYHVFTSEGYRYLMSSKKRAYNKTSNYLVSMDKNDISKGSPSYLGKLRSNLLGTEFTIYDHLDNPEHVTSPDRIREELGVVMYQSNIMGSRGPRKMKVLTPTVDENGERYGWRPRS